MRVSVVRACGLIGAVAIAACRSDSTTSAGCSPEALRPAIVVEVVAASGPAPNDSTRGAVHDGDYVDSLRPIQAVGNIQSLGAALNRPGTYNIMIEHAGYEPWEKDDVVVAGTACGIAHSVTVVAQLQPVP
ncbi:MAG TPA: hypothetical protein VJO52_11595 [Gemmatimonadaceae bacterium]|nr:hypothetical protein [Gemmatimonadaceae bacterium]